MIHREKLNFILSKWISKLKAYIKKDSLTRSVNFLRTVKLDKTFVEFQTRLVQVSKHISWKSPKTIGILSLALMVIFGGIFYLSTTTSAVLIAVNGQEIGYAANMSEAEGLIREVLSKQGEVAGLVAQTSDTIEYDKVRINKERFALETASFEQLNASIQPHIEGYGIQINDQVSVVVATEADADAVLQKYIEHFTKPSEENIVNSTKFEQTVTKVATKASPAAIKNVDQAVETLIKGDIAEIKYTVQANDSLWLIARKNNMLTDEVIAANPGFTEDTVIQPGQEIQLVKVEPYLTVISEGTKTVNEVIPFDVISKVDTSLGYGKSVVKQAGKDGEKLVTYNYVEKNGATLEKEVVKEQIVSEPVKQVIAKGPARPATYVATSRGSGKVSGMIWPLSGRVTSYYGYRWGSLHTGIDIDGDTGQPYVAAAGGEVISAGWNGNYGYSILIDHGNGVATRYAHSSKLKVSAGDTVSQGDTIGLVGSTGRSTGSHLHFEVIINGSTVNPLNYI